MKHQESSIISRELSSGKSDAFSRAVAIAEQKRAALKLEPLQSDHPLRAWD